MGWAETVSRLNTSGGWLAYVGQNGLIFSDVLRMELDAQASMIDVTSVGSPGRMLVRGPVDVTFTAQLAENYVWDHTARKSGPTPHLGALLALARRHPEEYEKLREGEEILKVLGG